MRKTLFFALMLLPVTAGAQQTFNQSPAPQISPLPANALCTTIPPGVVITKIGFSAIGFSGTKSPSELPADSCNGAGKKAMRRLSSTVTSTRSVQQARSTTPTS